MIFSGRSEELYERSFFYLRPATEDRPYFFRFFRYRTLRLIWNNQAGPPLPVTEWGLLFTWGGLALILLLAGAGIFLPLLHLGARPKGLTFFALIGLGYMLAEITFLAEIIYRLGRPAVAVPLVVGVFLLSSGLGSRLWGQRAPSGFALASALVLPPALLALRYFGGGALSAGLALVPTALLMGVPFPGGLTHLSGPQPVARAWAFGVNGFFSVLGALSATLICLQAGHLTTIFCAGVCYLLAGLVVLGGKK